MTIVNLTGWDIVLARNPVPLVIHCSGMIRKKGWWIFKRYKLPPKIKNNFYVVGQKVAMSFPQRDDFIVPRYDTNGQFKSFGTYCNVDSTGFLVIDSGN